jgi:hypothetical protein
MIKKIFIILFISIVTYSCGKKSNPLINGVPVENPKFKVLRR